MAVAIATTVEIAVRAGIEETAAEIADAVDAADGLGAVGATVIAQGKVDATSRHRNTLHRKADGIAAIEAVTKIAVRMIAGPAGRRQPAVKTTLCCRASLSRSIVVARNSHRQP